MKSLFTKKTIQSGLSKSNAQKIENFIVLCLTQKLWSKLVENVHMLYLYPYQRCVKVSSNLRYFDVFQFWTIIKKTSKIKKKNA